MCNFNRFSLPYGEDGKICGKSQDFQKEQKRKSNLSVRCYCRGCFGFCLPRVHAAGFHEVYAAESEEEDEDEPEKNSTYGLDSIVEGVFISQNTQTEVEKLGTSFEVVLVGRAWEEENWLQNWISVTRVPGKWKSFRINP